MEEKRRIYIHLYYSIEKGVDDEQVFDKRIASLYDELQSGRLVEEHDKSYDRFFKVKETPARGRKVSPEEDAIKDARRNLRISH